MDNRKKNWLTCFSIFLLSSLFSEAKQIGTGEDLYWMTQAERFLEMKDPSVQRVTLGALLMGLSCGLIGSYVVTRKLSLFGDTLSHAVLPGVVIAYGLGLPLSLGAFVFGVGSVAAIGFVKQMSRVKEDTVIGSVFTGFFALGLVLNSKTLSDIDLHHILIGNVLGIQGAEIVQICLISGIVLLFLLIFFRDLMLFCFDPTHARSIGINTGMLHYLLLGLLSLAAVAGLQTVGIILVVAMLVTPGATAYLLTDRFDRLEREFVVELERMKELSLMLRL